MIIFCDQISSVGPLHKAFSPSYFTYGSHSAFWMGFTPGVFGSSDPWLNPKAGKLFRMSYSGHVGSDGDESFLLQGQNIVDGFRRKGYKTIGSGAVEWFNTSTETGSVLTKSFEHFYFPGNTWSLLSQLSWIHSMIIDNPANQPLFVFLNIGETHVPYWYQDASWDPFPSPCIPFGSQYCSKQISAFRQGACLRWIVGWLIL